MGLDMYAYVANRAGQHSESYYDPNVTPSQEIAYWRKHPNLHGWMERLWHKKGNPRAYGIEKDPVFNGIELELTWDDVDKLEKDIKSGQVSKLNTTGFFFGNPSDDYYYEHDLEFCVNAKAELFLGRKVFYNSSW